MKSYNRKTVLFIAISVVAFTAIVIYYNHFHNNTSADAENNYKMVISYENAPHKYRRLPSVAIRSKDIISDLGNPDEKKVYNGYTYFVYNLPGQSKRFIVFSNTSSVLHDIYNVHKLLNKADFVDIKEGSSYKSVQAIDQHAYLYQTGNERATSEHKLDNGKSILIDYKLVDNVWVVKKIIEEESSITGKLIIDYFKNSK